MIVKQEKGRSFKGCIIYVTTKEGAHFLGGNMVGESVDELVAEFEAIRTLRPNLEVCCYHVMLSVTAEERRTDEQWRAIVAEYLKRMGFGNCQYILVRHTDEEHDHVHVVCSRIQIPDGAVVSDSQDYSRSEAVVRELEKMYALSPVVSSFEQIDRAPSTGEVRKFERQQLQFEQGLRSEPPDPPVRLTLQTLSTQLSKDQLTMPALIEHLQSRGVEVRVRLTEKGKWGISYRFAEQQYSGTQLGRGYTFQGLQKHKGVDYEPERDDAAIVTATSRSDRTQAQSATTNAADRQSDSGCLDFDTGTERIETAVLRLNFNASTAATAIREFGEQSLYTSAEIEILSSGIKDHVDQEAIQHLAGTTEKIGLYFERTQSQSRSESRNTEEVRRGIESLDRHINRFPERFLSRLEPPDFSAELALSCDWGQREWVAQAEDFQKAEELIGKIQKALETSQREQQRLNQELETARQANLLQQIFQNQRELERKEQERQELEAKIAKNQSDLKKVRSLLNRYQNSIEHEDERLESIYETLASEVQSKLRIMDSRTIDERIAFEILRSSPQSEIDLQALNYSPQVKQKLNSQPESAQSYQNEVLQKATVENKRLQALEILQTWGIAAQALHRPPEYIRRIAEITDAFRAGERLSERAKEAVRSDLGEYESTLKSLKDWYPIAEKLKKPSDYLESIQQIVKQFQSGTPLTERQIYLRDRDREASVQSTRNQLTP